MISPFPQVGFATMHINLERIRLSNTGIFAAHPPAAIAAVGAFKEDSRVFGYVLRQKGLPSKCHVFRCSRPSTALSIIACIRDVCQESYDSNPHALVRMEAW